MVKKFDDRPVLYAGQDRADMIEPPVVVADW